MKAGVEILPFMGKVTDIYLDILQYRLLRKFKKKKNYQQSSHGKNTFPPALRAVLQNARRKI